MTDEQAPRHWLVPIEGVSCVVRVAGDRIEPVCIAPEVPAGSEYALDPRDDRLVWIAHEPGEARDDATPARSRTVVKAARGAFSGGDLEASVVLPTPPEFAALSLALRDAVLYVGGAGRGESVGMFDLDADAPAWTQLELPPVVYRGKAIDALLFDGTRLIAVDDLIMPRYLLRYDVASPRAPRLLHTIELAAHSSYERVRAAALGRSFLVVVSTTLNHGTQRVHLAFHDRETLAEYGVVHAVIRGYRGRGEAEREFHHVDMLEDTLVVAAGAEGLGVLELGAVGNTGNPAVFASRCEAALRWVRVPERAVLRAHVVDGTRVLAVLADKRWGMTSELIALPRAG